MIGGPVGAVPDVEREHRRRAIDCRPSHRHAATPALPGDGRHRQPPDEQHVDDQGDARNSRRPSSWGLDDFEWLTVNAMKSSFAPFPERLGSSSTVSSSPDIPSSRASCRSGWPDMAIETTLVDHPVCTDAVLAQIRDRDTPNALFRQNLERIGGLLIAEATKNLPTVDGTVETPLTTARARRIAVQPVVVPIRRGGARVRRPGAGTAAERRHRVHRHGPQRGQLTSPSRTSTSCPNRSPAAP